MTTLPFPKDPDQITKRFKALRVTQPIGDIFIASMSAQLITQITNFDVRRVIKDERDVERYLGIQRPLNPRRVEEIKRYVTYTDATFPTSIILAIDSDYADFDASRGEMVISNTKIGESEPSTAIANLARVIDGQHRIAGLEAVGNNPFEVIVSIFVGSDISDQGYIFATVNLEQTKVNKSLAMDLFDLAKTRSPYKTCHNIAVALDSIESSPFFERIKRLGVARPDRPKETITQATFVNGLMNYISDDPRGDRDLLLKGRSLPIKDPSKFCLRGFFLKEQDVLLGKTYEQFFIAVRERWPRAWDEIRPGHVLNRTNGYRALASVFGPVYTSISTISDLVEAGTYMRLLQNVPCDDNFFNTENFPPGTSGESKLRRYLLDHMIPQRALL